MGLEQLLTAIADAIRSKKGTSDTINAQDFLDEISSLLVPTGTLTLLYNSGNTGDSKSYTATCLTLIVVIAQTNTSATNLYRTADTDTCCTYFNIISAGTTATVGPTTTAYS